jgi:hypothetical protein
LHLDLKIGGLFEDEWRIKFVVGDLIRNCSMRRNVSFGRAKER